MVRKFLSLRGVLQGGQTSRLSPVANAFTYIGSFLLGLSLVMVLVVGVQKFILYQIRNEIHQPSIINDQQAQKKRFEEIKGRVLIGKSYKYGYKLDDVLNQQNLVKVRFTQMQDGNFSVDIKGFDKTQTFNNYNSLSVQGKYAILKQQEGRVQNGQIKKLQSLNSNNIINSGNSINSFQNNNINYRYNNNNSIYDFNNKNNYNSYIQSNINNNNNNNNQIYNSNNNGTQCSSKDKNNKSTFLQDIDQSSMHLQRISKTFSNIQCSSNKLNSQNSQDCSICLEAFHKGDSVKELICGHIFHELCVLQWVMQDQLSCPSCRERLYFELHGR